eukprot:COSAG04_NODE_9836_length_828_cov_1.292181_3_plen_28_part_01
MRILSQPVHPNTLETKTPGRIGCNLDPS